MGQPEQPLLYPVPAFLSPSEEGILRQVAAAFSVQRVPLLADTDFACEIAHRAVRGGADGDGMATHVWADLIHAGPWPQDNDLRSMAEAAGARLVEDTAWNSPRWRFEKGEAVVRIGSAQRDKHFPADLQAAVPVEIADGLVVSFSPPRVLRHISDMLRSLKPPALMPRDALDGPLGRAAFGEAAPARQMSRALVELQRALECLEASRGADMGRPGGGTAPGD